MVFKKLLGALGMGGPSVDTVLHHPQVRPGGNLAGEIRITGGMQDVEIEHVALGLVAQVEVEDDEPAGVEFHRVVVSGRFPLKEGEDKVIPFEIPVPWETPLTSVGGYHLHGIALGVRTELAVAKDSSKGDLDPVSVEPLPAQEKVLEAFSQLGFQFKSVGLADSHLDGVRRELPFFQEIGFYPPPALAGRINEVGVVFVTGAHGLDVVLEADKRSGFSAASQDTSGRFRVTHDEALTADWSEHLRVWLEQVAARRSALGGAFGHQPGQMPGQVQGQNDEDRRGSGMGGMIAGAAVGVGAGLVGGMVIDEIADGVGDLFGDDDDEF